MASAPSLPPGSREVLDLGTGSGNVALLLAADGYDVTGIDLSSGMLDEARAKVESHPHPPTFLEADAADPPFPHGTMDAIVSRYLLWTLRDRTRSKLLDIRLPGVSGLRTGSKPDGRCSRPSARSASNSGASAR